MDTREDEKADAVHPEPSIGEAVQVSIVVEANQANKSASQMGSKPEGKMGGIGDSTSVLSIANYVELRRTKVNQKELKIERTMEYGQ